MEISLNKKNSVLPLPTIEGTKDSYFDRKTLRFQSIRRNANGNYLLIAENMVLDPYLRTSRGMGQSGKEELQATTGIGIETYGFTFLEFERDLNLIDIVFQPFKKAEGSLLPGENMLEGLLNITFKDNHPYYDLYYAYVFSNPSHTSLVVNAKEQYSIIKRNGKTSSIQSFKELNDTHPKSAGTIYSPLFFEEDDQSYYLSIPLKDKVVLEKKQF